MGIQEIGYPYLFQMDINQIFELFSSSENTSVETTQVSFDEHPYYYIGMFKKLLLNMNNYNYNISLSLQKENPNWSIDDLVNMGESIIFNSAYSFISKLDLESTIHIEILDTFSDTILLKCLEVSLKHFENLEEYEKCSFLLKVKSNVINVL